MTAATCICGAPAVFPKAGLCRPCYMRNWRAAHPEGGRTPKSPIVAAAPGVPACACGAAVWIATSGECKRCYHRRYARERSARIAEKVQSFNLNGYRFTADASLERAGDTLLGVVLRCEACGEQLGPVRSSRAAAVEIAAHLRRDHAVHLPSTTCAVPGCGNLRVGTTKVGNDLCRTHRALKAARR